MGYALSLIPDPTDPNTKLYVGQKLLLTVVATATGGDTFYSGAQVQIQDLGTGLTFDTSDANTNYSARQTVVLSDGNTVAKATFILDVLDGTPTTNATTLGLTVSSYGLPFRPTTFKYTTLAPRLSFQLTGPSQPYIPLPPSTEDNPLLPTAVVYTTIFTTMLTDGDTPIPNCVVDWKEQNYGELYTDLFLTQVYTYLHITDTQPLTLDDTTHVITDTNGSHFIRTVTDRTGSVSLYLVADNQNVASGLAAGTLDVWPYFDTASSTGSFVVADLAATPTVSVLPIPQYTDFSNVTGGKDGVQIDLTGYANTGDPVYTFINGMLGSATSWDPDKAEAYNNWFLLADAYSDYGYHANESNALQLCG
jgi:hypothetical protein